MATYANARKANLIGNLLNNEFVRWIAIRVQKANRDGTNTRLIKFAKRLFSLIYVNRCEHGPIRGKSFIDFDDAMVQWQAFANS